MKKIKVMLSFGTRPEAIKMSPIANKLIQYKDIFDVKICVTGQHRHMLDQVMNVFKLKPDIDLNLMKKNQDLFNLTSDILLGMKDVLKSEEPDVLLVHGDTTTAFASSMAAFYSNIPVGHVEAGLRTNNIRSPFPEEFNRQVVTRISNYHYAPTEQCKVNLMLEGVRDEDIFVTGNTVIDALHLVLEKIETDQSKKLEIILSLEKVLKSRLNEKKYVLITGHRRENFGQGFIEICQAVKHLATKFTEIYFIYPVHLNPNVQDAVRPILSGLSNVKLISPLDYESFLYLLKHSFIVLTDSGGIQEEAPSLGKPVLVMRDSTERPEAVEAGTVKIVGADSSRIIANVSDLIRDSSKYSSMTKAHNPYGDGKACDKIIEHLKSLVKM